MDAEQINQALYDKMAAEQEAFHADLLGRKPEEIIDHAYEYAMRQDILMEMEEVNLPADQAAALLASTTPLADLYQEWSNVDSRHMEDIRDVIEAVAQTRANVQEPISPVPFYQHSNDYARKHGDLAAFQASRCANSRCKEAIKEVIQQGLKREYLRSDIIGLLAEFGPERVSYVLAANIRIQRWNDGFSRSNKAWAEAAPTFELPYLLWDYFIKVHPTEVDTFITTVRSVIDQMREPQAISQNTKLSGLMDSPHLYSTLRAGLVDPETGEAIEALYDDAGQYQDAISRFMADFHSQEHPSNNLMQYFKLPDDPQMERSIKGKVHSAVATVEASGTKLYTRLDLSMTADLTDDELKAFTAQIKSQYRDGLGAELELLTIPAGKEAVYLRLWHDEISFFRGEEDGLVKKRVKAQKATRAIPLYQENAGYAREHGELDLFRASYKANVACRNAIEEAIKAGFDGMHLSSDAAKEVLAEFGPERVSHVLAATLLDKTWDKRFSDKNISWAGSVPMFDIGDLRYNYAVNSHPAVLDGFISMMREEISSMRDQPGRSGPKRSIKAQLAAEPAPGDPPIKPKGMEAR